MKFAPLKRKPVSEEPNETGYLLEPSAGLMSAFVDKLSAFPKIDKEGEQVSIGHFTALRILICLHEDGKAFLPNLINSLNEESPNEWPVTVMESDSIRQILEALEVSYLIRVVDHFMDKISSPEYRRLNHLIGDVWPNIEAMTKN